LRRPRQGDNDALVCRDFIEMRSKGPHFASGVERHAFFVQQDASTVDDELGLRAVTQVTALRAASGPPLALDQA
jgi:hypothetical protein